MKNETTILLEIFGNLENNLYTITGGKAVVGNILLEFFKFFVFFFRKLKLLEKRELKKNKMGDFSRFFFVKNK